MPDKEPIFQNADNRLIWNEIRHVRGILEEVKAEVEKINGRVKDVETTTTTHEERWTNHKDEHKRIGQENIGASIISGIAAIIGGITGGHFLK